MRFLFFILYVVALVFVIVILKFFQYYNKCGLPEWLRPTTLRSGCAWAGCNLEQNARLQNIGHWADIYQGDKKANFYQLRIINREKPGRLGLKGVNLDPDRVKRVTALMNEVPEPESC